MGFTTPCFIRKNTPELRKKLEELGYNHPTDVIEDERFCIATSPVNCNYHIIKGAFDDTNPHYTWNCAGRIDCGTNEELFLAIAALRDDTDDSQWFVYPPENTWFICDDDDINYVRATLEIVCRQHGSIVVIRQQWKSL
jgi:hypothetical protein